MMGKDEALKSIGMSENPADVKRTIEEFNERGAAKIRSGAARNSRTYRPKDKKARQEQYAKDKALREATLKNRIPFISPDICDGFYLCQGLVLVGGVSGRGKSTLAANILSGFLRKEQNRGAVVITNEESSEAIYNRTACVMLKQNFLDFQTNKLRESVRRDVETLALDLTGQVEVVDDEAWDMTRIEDVQAVLEYAAEGSIGIVIIDYYQTVCFSKERPESESFRVLKELGLYLKDYGRRVGVPVVTFAQLSTGKDDKHEFKDRVENDKTIYNHAFQAIEIVPDFEALQTKFIIRKDRFGYKQGKVIETKFVDGRFEPLEEKL